MEKRSGCPFQRCGFQPKEKRRREGSGMETGFPWSENSARRPRRARRGLPGGEDGVAHFVAAAVEGGVVEAAGLRRPEGEEEHAAFGAELFLGAGGVPTLGKPLRRKDNQRSSGLVNGVSAGLFAGAEEGSHAGAANFSGNRKEHKDCGKEVKDKQDKRGQVCGRDAGGSGRESTRTGRKPLRGRKCAWRADGGRQL